tara:strand:+ start:5459 stop:6016 length:558 start_codon:yes stop_codon:yes gene_type:complete
MSNINKVSLTQVKSGVTEIIRQIHLSNFRPDYIVGLTRGGLLPATMISHYLKVPMYTLDVSFRDKDSDVESNCWMSTDAFGALSTEDIEVFKNRWDVSKRKNILIVDDINDSGKTLQWIKDDWQAGCFPDQKEAWKVVWKENVKFAVLVNNESSKFETNYNSISINRIETPDLWVDFPWESWWQD